MIQPTKEASSSQEQLRLLGVAEEGLRIRRDSLNSQMGLIRRLRQHVLLGTELDEAARRANIPAVIGDVDQVIAILAGHEGIFDPPEWIPKGESPPKPSSDGRGRRQSGQGRRQSRQGPRRIRHQVRTRARRAARPKTTGPSGLLAVAVLRSSFIGRRSPERTLPQALAHTLGEDWEGKKVSAFLPGSGGKPETRLLADDVKWPDSILRGQIKQTVERCLTAATQGDGGFPQDKPPSENLRSLVTILGLPERQAEVIQTLGDWGIPVEEPVAAS